VNEFLHPSEVETLLRSVEGGPPVPRGAEGTLPWDFKRPERASKEQISALANLHEIFARSFGASLSGLLRTVTEVRLKAVTQMSYQEFTASLPNPTCYTVFACGPIGGQMMIEFGPSVMFPIIDRLLGGSQAGATVPDRPLTAIEWTLASTIARRALADLEGMWGSVRKLTFRTASSESNPLLLQSMPPNELVVVVGFVVRVGEVEGRAHVCIPYVTIEPLVGEVQAHSWYPPAGSAAAATAVQGALAEAAVRVSVVLAETTVTLRDLLTLEPGDLVETDRPAAGPVSILVEGKRKYLGRAVACRNRYAVMVEGPDGRRG